MRVDELFEGVLTEAESAEVDAVIERYVELLFEEGEAAPTAAPTEPTGPGGPGGGGPAPTGWGGGNRLASAWFATFASQLMWLSSATRIKKRLKELGLAGEGARRMTNAIKLANQHLNLLLANPGWRQQHWTFAGGPGSAASKKVAASMKKLLGTAIKKNAKRSKKKIHESLNYKRV